MNSTGHGGARQKKLVNFGRCRICSKPLYGNNKNKKICAACSPRPTSVKLSVEDLKIMASLKKRWGSRGTTAVVRRALVIADTVKE